MHFVKERAIVIRREERKEIFLKNIVFKGNGNDLSFFKVRAYGIYLMNGKGINYRKRTGILSNAVTVYSMYIRTGNRIPQLRIVVKMHFAYAMVRKKVNFERL